MLHSSKLGLEAETLVTVPLPAYPVGLIPPHFAAWPPKVPGLHPSVTISCTHNQNWQGFIVCRKCAHNSHINTPWSYTQFLNEVKCPIPCEFQRLPFSFFYPLLSCALTTSSWFTVIMQSMMISIQHKKAGTTVAWLQDMPIKTVRWC